MTRIEFIQKTGWLGAGMCAMGMAISLESCSGMYVNGQFIGNKFQVLKTDLTKSTKGYSILREDRFPGPVFLVNHPESGWMALLMVCTHARCEIYPAGEKLICPCHGSEFSHQGKVLASPAKEELFKFPVIETEEYIEIQLS